MIHEDDEWKVKIASSSAALFFSNKSLAVTYAKHAAKYASCGRGQVIVHGRNGKIQREFTYGDDPVRSAG